MTWYPIEDANGDARQGNLYRRCKSDVPAAEEQ